MAIQGESSKASALSGLAQHLNPPQRVDLFIWISRSSPSYEFSNQLPLLQKVWDGDHYTSLTYTHWHLS